MCGCECFISARIMHSSLFTREYCCSIHIKVRCHNAQNRRPGTISIRIFEIYNNSVRLHFCHIYNNSADMSMATMFPCNSKHYGIPHWKCVLRCRGKCPIIFLPSQEKNRDTTNTCPKICFHI